MAVPPNVPTSFVPRPSFSGGIKGAARNLDLGGAFAFLCYGVLAVALLAALAVFVYGRILANVAEGKQAELQEAQASIDIATVKSFIDLHDRLASGKQLLSGHVAFSGLLDLLEEITPVTVRLKSVNVTLADTRDARLTASGVATSFNALAGLSVGVGKDRRIKDAVFSGIAAEKGGAVSFSLAATVDPAIIEFSPSAAQDEVAPTTP